MPRGIPQAPLRRGAVGIGKTFRNLCPEVLHLRGGKHAALTQGLSVLLVSNDELVLAFRPVEPRFLETRDRRKEADLALQVGADHAKRAVAVERDLHVLDRTPRAFASA